MNYFLVIRIREKEKAQTQTQTQTQFIYIDLNAAYNAASYRDMQASQTSLSLIHI